VTGEPDHHRTPYPHDGTVHGLFEEWADRTPDAPAMSAGGVTTTYRELDRRANQLAHHLRGLGVTGETRVGLCVRDGRWVVGALAVLKAGGAYVPMDPNYPAERLTHMCAEAGVTLVLGEQDFPDDLAEPDTRLDVPVSPLSLAYVMFTSGSTGTPKAVAVGHRNIVRLVRSGDSIDVRPGEVALQAATVSFDAATLELWGALLNGAHVVTAVDPDAMLVPARLRQVLVEHGVNVLFLPTALLRQLAAEDPTVFRTVRHLSFGGEQADVRTVTRLAEHCPATELLNLYGPTEITVYATSYRCAGREDTAYRPANAERSEAMSQVPIGSASANSSAYVLDEGLQPVSGDEPGELYLGGDGVARGYLGRPSATAQKFLPDPFSGVAGARMYRTGDLVRRRADGALVFLGRVDRQVKVRGHRVEPAEVEEALRADGGVVDVVVLADRDAFGDMRLLAYVVLGDGVAVADVRARLTGRLPAYLVPAVFVQVARMPLKANGKVDTDALPPPTAAVEAPAGLTEEQERVRLVWQEVLGVTVPSAEVSFFELGGNSLAAARVRSRLAALSEVDVPVRLVFDHPTVAAQAEAVSWCTKRHLVAVPAPVTRTSLADLLAEFENEDVSR
jgi:amino acid adenylation domain-containing protein